MKQNPVVDYTSLAPTRMFEWVYQICSEAQPIRARTTLHFNLRRFFWASFEAIIDALELPHAEPPLPSMMIYLIRTAQEFTGVARSLQTWSCMPVCTDPPPLDRPILFFPSAREPRTLEQMKFAAMKT
jgi:hypothetical protein